MVPRLALLTLGLGLEAAARPLSAGMQNIKNVVVLVQENRSFDTLVGGLNYTDDIDGLAGRKTPFCNPANISQPHGKQICGKPTANNIAKDDPDHTIWGGNMQVFGKYHPGPDDKSTMNGFVYEQDTYYTLGGDLMEAAEVINYYTPDQVPVTNAIAENFVLFDRWFASIPGPTDPNRAYLTSGTSHGEGGNTDPFYDSTLPQKSIFQQLSENGITWANYENSTKSDPPFAPDAMFYSWTKDNGKDKTNVFDISQFYKDAEAGKLPQFTWINPECCSYMSMHPKSPINMGENFMKGIYDAIRASPQWNETLFIITWDEHGGFADHVPPPTGVPPGDDIPWTEQPSKEGTGGDKNYTFNFDRLGIRVPTFLISPWVEAGVVEHQAGKNEYTHTSILSFVAELWELEPLTPRVSWSPSFSGLITNKYRDSPKKLPEAAGYPLKHQLHSH